MSWQAASFVVIGLVLAGGFAWFERSRPPARLIGLVAALAALAVAGRLLLAPIPNVVATTDIVLFTGYAIGGAPGFAVGALSALISNFWLGQGPWTPWQMAGWGLVGLGGAGLAALTARRLGRIGLAVACGVAGLAYGALLDLSVMVTYGGEQSIERYLALSVRGIPFNIAHALGNVTLALIAGPALVRMLERFRSRTEYTWRDAATPPPLAARPRRSGTATAAVLAALIAAGTLLVATQPARAAGAGKAVAWLSKAQNSDGGFGAAPSDSSNPEITGWAMLGLEAAGRNPLDVRRNGNSPIDYLRDHVGQIDGTGDLERTILALRGAGVSARDFAGRDLVRRLLGRRSGDGSFEGQVNLTAFGILALAAAGETGGPVKDAARWLRAHRNADGGWGFQPGAASDPDTTGGVLQALAAAASAGIKGGVGYLKSAQEADGGWALVESGAANSQSTAWAIQGLLAAGVDPAGVRKNGRNGLDFLAARQQGDGHYRYSKASDQTPTWVTGQALLAVNSKPFPLSPVAQSPSGSGGSGGSAGAGAGFPSPAPSFPPAPSAGSPGSFPSFGGGGLGGLEGLGGGGGGGLGGGALPPASGLEQPPGVPGGGPSSDVGGATDSSPPAAVSAAPQAEEWSDGSDWPFIGLGYGVVAAIAGLGLLYVRGPIF
jgi:energy-coupling factor transport system substrate-specific component